MRNMAVTNSVFINSIKADNSSSPLVRAFKNGEAEPTRSAPIDIHFATSKPLRIPPLAIILRLVDDLASKRLAAVGIPHWQKDVAKPRSDGVLAL